MTHGEKGERLGQLIFTFFNSESKHCTRTCDVYEQQSNNDVCVEIGSTRYFITDATIDRVEMIARCAFKSGKELKMEKAAFVVDVLQNPKPSSFDLTMAIDVLSSIHETAFIDSTMHTFEHVEIAAQVRAFLHGYVHIEYVLAKQHVFKYGPMDSSSTKIYSCDYPELRTNDISDEQTAADVTVPSSNIPGVSGGKLKQERSVITDEKNSCVTVPSSNIVIVSGKRKSGKTTFAQNMFPGLPIICMLPQHFATCDATTLPSSCVVEVQVSPHLASKSLQNSTNQVFIANGLRSFVQSNFEKQ